MTLQELLPAIRQLPVAEKIALRRLLEEETEPSPETNPVADELPATPTWESLYFSEGKPELDLDGFLKKGGTFHIYSPFDCPGAAAILMAELEKSEAENSL